MFSLAPYRWEATAVKRARDVAESGGSYRGAVEKLFVIFAIVAESFESDREVVSVSL